MPKISMKSFQVPILSVFFFLITLAAPVIDFTFNNSGTCSGTPITFNPSVSGDNPFTYLWDFGDGTSATASNPSHTYTALGCGFQNFTVELKVTDRNGVSSRISKVVQVVLVRIM